MTGNRLTDTTLSRDRILGRVCLTALIAVTLTACGSTNETVSEVPAKPPGTPFTLPATTAPTSSPIVEPTTATPEPTQPKLGQKQTTDLGDVTVYSVRFPVRAQDSTANDIRTKGMQFAVAEIKACSNGTVNPDGYGLDVTDFQLIDQASSAYSFWNVQVGARSPNLTDTLSGLDTPIKGQCKRGWLTFELPPKSRIQRVLYAPSDGLPLTWEVRS